MRISTPVPMDWLPKMMALGLCWYRLTRSIRADVPFLGVNLHVIGLAPIRHQLCHLGDGLVVREQREDPAHP